jgi:hypothetical protein
LLQLDDLKHDLADAEARGITWSWTEFSIDAQSQQLHVTTWSIEPYTAEDLSANPESVIARTPQVISEFTVNPHLGGNAVIGNQPASEVDANFLGEIANWKDTIGNFSGHSISELAQHIATDSSVAALIPDADNLTALLGMPATYDSGNSLFG